MFAIAIHGGAGTITSSLLTPEKETIYRSELEKAVQSGYRVLREGGTALDAVTAAVVFLEDCPLFNAGRGAVFNARGGHEMDASIMEGRTLMAGAVSCVSGVRNPVLLARTVMERSEHVFLTGNGAEEFAREKGLAFENEDYFFDKFRFEQWQSLKGSEQTALDHTGPEGEKKFGTVGAVALDASGSIAAATSTGGMTNKKYGRVGDSPVIGAGTYANDLTCAVSCTGHGELFIRNVVAYDISCLMEYKNFTLKQACDLVVYDKLVRAGGEGGLVALDAKGNIEMPFNSEGMYRASVNTNGELFIGINRPTK